MRTQKPHSISSCAACKFLKRKCTSKCQFAPYFHSKEPKKFAKIHKVFGASNVSKILNVVPENQRDDTVNSLVYEAELRLRDPVYGCIGAIASLQQKMVELQYDLIIARARLAGFVGLYFDDHASTMARCIEIPESNGMVEGFNHGSMSFDQFGPL